MRTSLSRKLVVLCFLELIVIASSYFFFDSWLTVYLVFFFVVCLSTALLFPFFFKIGNKIVIFATCLTLILCLSSLAYLLSRTYQNPRTTYGIFSEQIGNSSPNLIELLVGNIPEIDQIKVGTALAPLYHGMFSREEVRRAQLVSSPVYKQMQKDAKWSTLPSSLGNVYLSTLHLKIEQNQYYAYVPKHITGQKLPVLLFLHGFGGNFTSYLYTLSSFADTYHVAIIAPSYKNGIWDADSLKFIDTVIHDAEHKFDIDPENYYLMGFSNGGLIVPDVYRDNPDRYKGLIFLSTYLDKDVLLKSDRLASWQNKKILVIQGNKDERIEPENTRKIVALLKEKNIDVTLKEFQNDHFLFFENSDDVQTLIGATYFGNVTK